MFPRVSHCNYRGRTFRIPRKLWPPIDVVRPTAQLVHVANPLAVEWDPGKQAVQELKSFALLA